MIDILLKLYLSSDVQVLVGERVSIQCGNEIFTVGPLSVMQ